MDLFSQKLRAQTSHDLSDLKVSHQLGQALWETLEPTFLKELPISWGTREPVPRLSRSTSRQCLYIPSGREMHPGREDLSCDHSTLLSRGCVEDRGPLWPSQNCLSQRRALL